MIARTTFASILVTLSSSTLCAGEPISTEEILEAEKTAIESRKSIKSGRFVVEVSFPIFLADPNYTSNHFKYEIFLDGVSKRSDAFLSSTAGSGETAKSIVWSKDTFIRAPLTDNSLIQLSGPSDRPPSTFEIPDPRLLGFVPWNFASISQFGLEEFLLKPTRKGLKGERLEVIGKDVIDVTFYEDIADEKWQSEFHLSVDQGYQPVYLSSWLGEGEERILRSVEVELKSHDNNGKTLWFPKRAIFKSQSGSRINEEEIQVISVADINKNIDSREFTLTGLGLKPGRLVLNDGRFMWWTGDKLVPKIIGQDAYQGDELHSRNTGQIGGNRWLLIINALVLAFLGVLFVLKVINHRSPG